MADPGAVLVSAATAVLRTAQETNQLAAAGSGVHPRLPTAQVTALGVGAVPVTHTRGSIGTGGLGQLAEIALTPAGERPWGSGRVAPPSIRGRPRGPGGGLAFISGHAA